MTRSLLDFKFHLTITNKFSYVTSTLSRATIPKYVLNFFLWGPSALPIAGSTWTTGLSAPGDLVDKDHRHVALRVHFMADSEADASEGGGRGGGGEGGGRGGEPGGEAMILYTKKPGLGSFGVMVLESVSGIKVVDFRQPEVLLVKKVHQFEALADMGLNGEYNLKELMTLVSLGAARTRSDPKLRPTTRQIVSILVSILDGNDKLIMGENMESREDWRETNTCSFSLVKTIQGLGIQ
ncbi:Receptor like protein kinase S.2 [Glycine soja]